MANVHDLRRAMFRGGSGFPKPPQGGGGGSGGGAGGAMSFMKKDYTPVQASEYFGKGRFVTVNEHDRLYIYETENSGGPLAPYLLFLHGGGYSGLTWAPLIKQLSPMFNAEFGAVDMRGHGRAVCQDESDLSTEKVTADLFHLVQELSLGERPLILIGHSMGGAFAIHLAAKLQEETNTQLSGLIVIDVVEGSALESLSGMQHVLRNRPKEFQSLQAAIEWCVRSGQTRNTDSARVSMPGQLKLLSGGVPNFTQVDEGAEEADGQAGAGAVAANPSGPQAGAITTVTEEAEEEDQETVESSKPVAVQQSTATVMQAPSSAEKYVWRIDLKKTEPYWRGWFEGLSTKFLAVKAPKLLLLAGVDRLDKELMVAQMQGKFQMQVLSSVGHIVHEDAPDRVAEHIASFLVRNRIIAASEAIPRVFPGC